MATLLYGTAGCRRAGAVSARRRHPLVRLRRRLRGRAQIRDRTWSGALMLRAVLVGTGYWGLNLANSIERTGEGFCIGCATPTQTICLRSLVATLPPERRPISARS